MNPHCSYDQKKYESMARRIIEEQAAKTKARREKLIDRLLIAGMIFFWLAIILVALWPRKAQAQVIPSPTITEASYYTVKSCLREGTSGIMANGRKLDDNTFICASWDYAFGTRLRVTNIKNNKSVVVVVSDRGPSKRLCRKGRKLDLSLRAFTAIADRKSGVAMVRIENLGRAR